MKSKTPELKTPVKFKKYRTINKVLSALMEIPEKDVKDFNVVHRDGEVSNKEFNEAIKEYGIWGFIDDEGVAHCWMRGDIGVEQVMTFIAHETGHMNGRKYKNEDKEEAKAFLFQQVATYAYQEAVRLIEKKKPKK